MKKESLIKRIWKTFIGFFGSNYLFKDKKLNKRNVFLSLSIDSRERLFTVSFILLLLQSFYIIKDMITDFIHTEPVPFVNVAAEIILFFSSLVVLLLHFTKKGLKDLIFNRILLISYYILIAISMCLYMYGDLYRHPDSFSVAYFYLIIFAIAPCPRFVDNIVIFFLVLIGSYLNTFVFNVITEGVFQYFIVIFMFLIIALYLRTRSLNLKVSQIKEEELREELLLQTSIDPLTTALNRRGLEKYLNDNFDEWCLDKADVAMVMFDIDHFKEYNDNYSHIAGDECLKRIAQAIMQASNNNMSHLFRYGGDEFVFFVFENNKLDVLKKLLELNHIIEKLKMKTKNDLNKYVTISMGCAMLDDKKMNTIEDFFKSADDELYNAKNCGKNCVSFERKIYR